ncbi:hypothetical protein [Bordetella holmesii]|uniref:N-acetyltransferase YedL n=2 Tax=Bordetella holmesii TaxID=35814 RepID=A0ABN0RW19_9BORD|nr:hypothetical protein [Bordetella holmesii]AHV94356.1 hypothetical protein D560_2773 [Bordetella holmesii ATCC 51541]AIT27407.1 hypothetical protein D558_2751 [Bordetella holmesii 44057]EWM42775.1 hypothetical protein D556_2748 [Bordetella holmesii 41130]EWM47999.1 hypothetical protein D555_2795 [Bordetella holmesii 35009]AMD46244.1 hypothetical protein H558_12490 [Bordetella holmesii H558]
MENQEVLVAFAQAIQELAAKTATAESALHCLIQAQDEPTRARFGEAFNTVARGLIQPRPDRPLTGQALAQLALAVNAYLEAAGHPPLPAPAA